MLVRLQKGTILLQDFYVTVNTSSSLIHLLDKGINLLMKRRKVRLVTFNVAPDSIDIAKMLVRLQKGTILLQGFNVTVNSSGGLIHLLDKGINLLMKRHKVRLVTFNVAPDSVDIAKMLV